MRWVLVCPPVCEALSACLPAHPLAALQDLKLLAHDDDSEDGSESGDEGAGELSDSSGGNLPRLGYVVQPPESRQASISLERLGSSECCALLLTPRYWAVNAGPAVAGGPTLAALALQVQNELLARQADLTAAAMAIGEALRQTDGFPQSSSAG